MVSRWTLEMVERPAGNGLRVQRKHPSGHKSDGEAQVEFALKNWLVPIEDTVFWEDAPCIP